jgi:hypothetical protein
MDKMSFQSPNYTQTPNDFFTMLPDMSEAELRVTLVMIRQTFGFHRNGFKLGVTKLADAAGLSRQGALDGAAAAEKRGTFRRTNPDAITEAEWELVVDEPLQPVDPSTELIPPLQPVEGSPLPGGGQVGVKERLNKKVKKGDLVDGVLFFAGQAKDQQADKVEELLQELERGLRVNITRTTKNQQTAKRILKDARPVSRFLAWVVADEWRSSHLYLYADLEKVWRDWPQAFPASAGNPNEVRPSSFYG